MAKALGIDLGTSNCCVALLDGNKPRVLPDERGNSTTPSYMTILANGKSLVGHLAKVQVISNPYQTAYQIKRLMGRRVDDPKIDSIKQIVGYQIVAGENGQACIKLGEQLLSPIDISCLYLKAMKDIAHYNLQGEEVKDVIITVPAYFNDMQRKATKEAGEKAGFNVLRLINEPTAAALAYGYRKEMNKKIAVFDLGGGTFDISILEVNGGVFEVIGTHGDSFLGGHDFDNRIVELVIEDFKAKNNLDLRMDKMALQRIKDACENAKCELSSAEKAQINLPFIASHDGSSLNLDFIITRKKFEEVTADLVKRTIDICDAVLKESGLKKTDLEDILLVGGQTRMPMVGKAVAEYFGKPPVKGVHPDEAVALGAAIQAEILETKSKDVLLLDVTPLSLGILSSGDIFTKIVEKNTKVPIRVSKLFTTTHDNQERVKVVILQGEGVKASQNFPLGEFVLEGIRKAPRMEPKIQVTFRIDADGILNVQAQDLDTGQVQQVTIRDYISPDEVRKSAGQGAKATDGGTLFDEESLEVVPVGEG